MSDTLESIYTSTSRKLIAFHDRFGEWRNETFRPISLQLAPTDLCNLQCEFCSVSNRKGDVLDFEKCQYVLASLCDIGLGSVEFTGGGEPTLYPYLKQLIELANQKHKIPIGLITNGAKLESLGQNCLKMLEWIRVSLSGLDYGKPPNIPEIPVSTTLGFSYVVNDLTTKAVADQILNYVKLFHPAYLRIVPNCLSPETMKSSQEIARRLGLLDLMSVAFFQTKSHNVPPLCRMGFIKPFLAPDGFFYFCSANPLIDRKFNTDFRMGAWNEVSKIWGKNQNPWPTNKCQSDKCFFEEHNKFIETVIEDRKHWRFI